MLVCKHVYGGGVLPSLPILVFEVGFLTESEAHRWGRTDWTTSSRDLPVFVHHPTVLGYKSMRLSSYDQVRSSHSRSRVLLAEP